MQEAVAAGYRAFLSYSHKDKRWASRLHKSLEGYRVPRDLAGRKTSSGAVPKSLRPIFRDREDFSAGHTIPSQTLEALGASFALIVICSPASATSRYVNEEIRLFKTKYPERRIIPIIVDGEPGDPERECFPPAMRFKVLADGTVTGESEELLAADARPEADGKDIATLKVIAGLLEVGLDEIRKRQAAAQRRRIVTLTVIAASMLGLAVVASYLAWLADRRLTYAQDASIDLVILTSTLRAIAQNTSFQEVYGEEKLGSDIFTKIAGESGRGKLECKKAHRLAELSLKPNTLLRYFPELTGEGERIKQDWERTSVQLRRLWCDQFSEPISKE